MAQVHRSFFDVGCDVVETDTFGSTSVVLAEYGLADRARELTRRAAELACTVRDEFSTPERPRWVAGSMGPGTKFPTLGQISYAEFRDAYEEQALGLLEGGVDLLLIETQFDLLSIKAAINGARRAMVALDRFVPLQTQVTIELTGRMLPGTEIGAALTVLDAMQVDVVGLNCATGPVEMSEALRHLSAASRVPIACIPNAGLPSVVDGKMHYDLTPEDLAEHLHRFVTEFGVSAIGGCCGTTPAHLAAVVERCAGATPAARTPVHEPGAASIYTSVPFRQDTSFLVVGERTNANGSKAFREAMLDGDWDTCVAMARDQVKEGSHLIDVCVDYTGADGVADMTEVASRFCTQSSVPLMVDSTEGPVVRAALEWIGGRPDPQLGQPRGGRRARHPARHLPPAGPRVRGRRRVHLHRRGGPGPHGGVEGARGPQHPRHRRRALRPGAPRTCSSTRWPCRCRRAWRRAGRTGSRRSRASARIKARAARRLDHPRALQRVLRPEPGRPPGAQLGVPARVRGGRTRLGHRARVEDPPAVPHRRAGQGGVPRPGLRPPRATVTTRCRSCLALFEGVKVSAGAADEHLDWPVDRRLSPAHHRRQPQRARGRPDRGARVGDRGPRHRQRHPARRA